MKKYQYLFGPVPSRRFGRSLGIDLTPYKTCSMDCVFCQLGRTTCKTLERKEYVPVWEVVSELEDWIKAGGKADFLTLAGSGEPTLHSRFGEVIAFARRNSDIPVALLTNGSTMHAKEVRDAACGANVAKISLSAWDQASMDLVNRPCDGVNFDAMIEGMLAFRDAFEGELWLEVFIVGGINDSPETARRIAALARAIRPDRIHINTAVRPAAEKSVASISRETAEEIASLFEPRAEAIAEFKGRGNDARADAGAILDMLRRRPCTGRQIADVCSMHLNEVSKHLGFLSRRGAVRREDRDGETYYVADASPETASGTGAKRKRPNR